MHRIRLRIRPKACFQPGFHLGGICALKIHPAYGKTKGKKTGIFVKRQFFQLLDFD